MLTRDQTWQVIQSEAVAAGIDPLLAGAIALAESSWNAGATRFEPSWRYFYEPQRMAVGVGSTLEEERRGQATSWGLMQVMGAVARELGYRGKLAQLAELPGVGAKLGCQKLRQLLEAHPALADVIASYNAGSPRKLATGQYVNQHYVDVVFGHLKELTVPVATDAGQSA